MGRGKSYDLDIVVDACERKKALASRHTEAETQTQVAEAAKQTQTEKKKGRRAPRRVTDNHSSGGSSSDSDSDTDECLDACLTPWSSGALYSPSASYRQVDIVCGSHQYTISGFSMARSMGCGTRLCSDFFEVCGQLFRLEVYPGGFTADTRKYVSVFLTTPGSTNPNHVLYEIAVLDQTGHDRHIVEKRGAYDRGGFSSGPCCMYGPMLSYNRGIVAALPKFIKAKFLEEKARRYMPCDMLCFRINVQILQGWSSAPMVHYHASYAPAGRPPGPHGMHMGMPPMGGMGAMPPYGMPGMNAQLPGFMHMGPMATPHHAPHAGMGMLNAVAPSMPGTLAPGGGAGSGARPVQSVPHAPAPMGESPPFASPPPAHGAGLSNGYYSGGMASPGMAVGHHQHASPVRPGAAFPAQYLMHMTSPHT